MITSRTKDDIVAAARIEEVVGDFVNLKKRGSNFVGLCPFHTEKTPSFHVSPSRGIYKCFGCGRGGDSVNFVMEHEKFSYPEALRYLAQKYNVTVEETGNVQQEQGDKMLKDSLYIINQFAQKYYHENLVKTTEGRNIGLSYFKERGFSDEMLKKFMLGYALADESAFTKTALKNGFLPEMLAKAGLSKQKSGKEVDFFYERVIFPILNLSGKVVAFAGRTMVKDDRVPKYINSPETEIYHKSHLVFGISQARNAIRKEDECFLTEGYTDVISMHQAGIENVVASSGTSLTPEQVKLIKRFTPNITILYDGDSAGVKAALRGIELMVEEDVNVRVVLLPDGDDPDSFLHKKGSSAFRDFIAGNKKHFLHFKTEWLMQEAGNDPLKKAGVIKDIVETLARMPDPIKRSLLIKDCGRQLEVSEQILISEVNKLKRRQFMKEAKTPDDTTDVFPGEPAVNNDTATQKPMQAGDYFQELGIIRLLLEYGEEVMEDGQKVAELIFDELKEAPFYNQDFQLMLHEMEDAHKNAGKVDYRLFMNHEDRKLRDLAIEIISFPYNLSENWKEKHEIFINTPNIIFRKHVISSLHHFKLHKLMNMKMENQGQLKVVKGSEDDENHYMVINIKIDQMITQLSQSLGTVTLSYFK